MILNPEQKVEELSNSGCDICEHFPLMLKYGKQCEHITEMGVRGVVSTWGWIASNPKKLVCYDIDPCPVYDAIDTCADLGIDFSFHVADTREIEIEETDLLFIDTEHNYLQLKTELSLHGNKAKKYLIFHDTVTFGERDSNAYNQYENLTETDTGDKIKQGLNLAIKEFMEANPHWVDEEEVTNNNGFKIIKRK